MCTNDNLENRKGRKRAREKISVVGGGCGDDERVKQKPRRTQQNIKIKNKTKQNMEGKEQKTMVWMQEFFKDIIVVVVVVVAVTMAAAAAPMVAWAVSECSK